MNREHYKPETVQKIVADYCSRNGITEAEFAVLIGIHPGSLPRIKSGEMCSEDNLFKISRLGGVPMSELLQSTPSRIEDEINAALKQKNLPALA